MEYASRSLTRVERDSFAQIEREMAAILFAVTRFHTYIYGKPDVTIATDHRPLVSIYKKSLTSAPRRLQTIKDAVAAAEVQLSAGVHPGHSAGHRGHVIASVFA